MTLKINSYIILKEKYKIIQRGDRMNGQTSKGDDLLIKTSEEFLQKANLNPKLYEEYIQWAKNDWEGFWDYFGKNENMWSL